MAASSSNPHAVFPLAQAAYEDSAPGAPSPIALLESLVDLVRRQSVFSDNETLEDVNTADLKLLLAEHMLGMALVRRSQPPHRLADVTRGKAHLERFVSQARRMDAFEGGTGNEEETEAQYEERVAAGRAFKGPSREVKIERFKRQRAVQKSLENLQLKADEASVREAWQARITLACLEALDEMEAANKEMEVLSFAANADQDTLRQAREMRKTATDAGIEVTRIAGAGFEVKRETFKDGVFRQFHRPPTVSLEEYAEAEMEKLRLQEQAQKQAPAPVLSLNEIAEQGLEDDQDQVDVATVKARNWDDWKDAHPKGAGVTKRF
jgi:immunoglobulin-binding protein 1